MVSERIKKFIHKLIIKIQLLKQAKLIIYHLTLEMEEKRIYFKVPLKRVKATSTDKGGSNLHIVGIIDASGSMSSWWKWIAEFWNSDSIPKENLHTITFDGTARHC